MALFKKKEEEIVEKANVEKPVTDSAMELTSKKKKQKKETSKDSKLSAGRDLSSVIVRPRITEKAVRLTEENVYTFEVREDASKFDVRDAVKEIFGVTPIKVRIVKNKTRHYMSRMRGRKMTKKGEKKAYVYLKEGDRIEIV